MANGTSVTKGDGKFLSLFSDKLYELSKVFAPYVGEEYFMDMRKQSELRARAFEIRSMRIRVGIIYRSVKGMRDRLEHVDEAMCYLDRFLMKDQYDEKEKERCWAQLESCARRWPACGPGSTSMRLRGKRGWTSDSGAEGPSGQTR